MAGTLLELSEGHDLLTEELGVAPAQDLGPDNESEGLLSGDSKASKQSKAAKASRRGYECPDSYGHILPCS